MKVGIILGDQLSLSLPTLQALDKTRDRLVMAEDRRIVFDAEGRHDHTVTHHPREVLSGKAAVPAADSS